MPEGSSPDFDKISLIDELFAVVRADGLDAFTADGAPKAAFAEFARQLVDDATGEAAQLSDPAILANHARRTWTAGSVRPAGVDIVETACQDGAQDWRSAALYLTVITDDKPFLVDSISAALTSFGKSISFFANGVIDVRRDASGARVEDETGRLLREAVIHISMDPAADADEQSRICAEVRSVLADVTQAVDDWEAMRARLASSITALERTRPRTVDRQELREAIAFLKWLWDNRFAFLGVRRFTLVKEGGQEKLLQEPELNLGILRDEGRRVVRATDTEDGVATPAQRAFLASSEPILITKANARSVVHRRGHMDYVGVKLYHPDGSPAGEERFAGLFTADAYNKPATDIPWLSRKIRNVVERAQYSPGGHNEKALSNILETFPRDEIFQISENELHDVALGVLRLYKRPRTKLFLRRDRFDRFVSALVFIPRDRFNSSVREETAEILRSAYDGRISAFYPYFGDGPLARVHFIIGLSPGAPEGPPAQQLEARIAAAAQTWQDGLREALREAHRGAPPASLRANYEDAFSPGYRDVNHPGDAIVDIAELERLTETASYRVRAFRRDGDAPDQIRLKLYHLYTPTPPARTQAARPRCRSPAAPSVPYSPEPARSPKEAWAYTDD
ncbi:MAG: hypothetical protein AAGL49_08285, partial [Pseudomonadota bacterium]